MSPWELVLRGTWELVTEAFSAFASAPARVWGFFSSPNYGREKVGYVVWTFALIVFGVPEIWASKDNDLPVPTLSGTVGTIERRHDWASIFVILALTFALFHAVRVGQAVVRHRAHKRVPAADQPLEGVVERPQLNPSERTPAPKRTTIALTTERVVVEEGRVTRATQVEDVSWVGYYIFALALVAIGIVVPWWVEGWKVTAAEKQIVGESGYSAIGLAFFVIPGLLAYGYGKLVPFPTVFRTFLALEQRARFFAVVVAAGLTFLMLHLIFYPWPSILPWFDHLHHLNYCVDPAHAHAPICIAPGK